MKKLHFFTNGVKIDEQRIRLALAVLTLMLFVLGGGAPNSSGGGG